MRSNHRIGRRVPLLGLSAALLAILLLPTAVLAGPWSDTSRVSNVKGSRLDSLHQLASGNGSLHLAHPRIGGGRVDDRVVYQRSDDDGATWTRERTLFTSTPKYRNVVPNLAVAASGRIVVVAWRARGPDGSALFARTSRNAGVSFGRRELLFSSSHSSGIGVPAVDVGDGTIAVAWTSRGSGRIKVRVSRDDGLTFSNARSLGRTKLSIDCRRKVTDGLVGVAANERKIHVAWSYAGKRACQASKIHVKTSKDAGRSWKRQRTITKRRSYGWPELKARGNTVIATVQSPTGGIIVARSGRNGRDWNDILLKPGKGQSLSSADVVLLSRGRVVIAYVIEKLRRARLTATQLVSRNSSNDGRRFKAPRPITSTSKQLRMAPNLAASGGGLSVVFQSGPLDGSPHNLLVSRRG